MIKSLTSLRFVFALLVFLSHSTYTNDEGSFFFIYKDLLKQGFVGVNFFFILSGFILSYTYFGKFITIKSDHLKRFYSRRFLKIYPSYWFSLALSFYFAENLWENPEHNRIIIANALLIQSWIPDKWYQWFLNPPSWSLAVEVFFYLLFPLIIFIAHKSSLRKFSWFVLLLFLLQSGLILSLESFDIKKFWFYIFPASNLILFLSGIWLFLVYKKYGNGLSRKINTGSEIASLIIFAVAIYCSRFVPDNFRFICYYLPFAALIIFIFSFEKGFISALLKNPVMVYLGKISFQFYLLHFLCIWFWGKMDYFYIHGMAPSLQVFLSFATTLILSLATYHLVEIPFQKIKK